VLRYFQKERQMRQDLREKLSVALDFGLQVLLVLVTRNDWKLDAIVKGWLVLHISGQFSCRMF